MEVSGQLHASVALIPEKETQYALDRRLCGPQRRYRRDGEEKKSLPSTCLESNPGLVAHSLVTVLAELFEALSLISRLLNYFDYTFAFLIGYNFSPHPGKYNLPSIKGTTYPKLLFG
jgi:hypothetical protein